MDEREQPPRGGDADPVLSQHPAHSGSAPKVDHHVAQGRLPTEDVISTSIELSENNRTAITSRTAQPKPPRRSPITRPARSAVGARFRALHHLVKGGTQRTSWRRETVNPHQQPRSSPLIIRSR